MKSMTKRTGAILAASALATTLATAGAFILNNGEHTAVAAANEGLTYFYDKLGNDENAKKFYNTFKTLSENGTLKSGKLEYDIVANAVVTANDVQAYVNGANKRVPEAYSAGRDSFIMDNPDLFYVDLFGTSISAGMMGNNYVAYLDSSRVTSLYRGDLNTVNKVEKAIADYENALTEIVDEAKAVDGVVEQIKYVNNYICEHTDYSDGTQIIDGRYVDTPDVAFINTSYGALVNRKAVCEGYTNAFKAVMDRLDIPCVSVHGYHIREDGTSVPHSWNVVNLEGKWYNVDVTFNDTENNKEKWLLMGTSDFNASHMEDKVISSSGFELQYPAVNPYNYGETEDKNGMYVYGDYEESTSSNGETFKVMRLNVSYENKSGLGLKEEGKYLAFRYGDEQDGEIVWGLWTDAVAVNEVAPTWMFNDTQSTMFLYPGVQYVQVAVMNRAPDFNNGATYPDDDRYGENAGKPYNYLYSAENLKNSDFYIEPSVAIENDGYKTYVPAPFGYGNPSNSGDLQVNDTYDITVTYTEKLEKIDLSADVEMSFTCSRNDSTVRNHAKLENFKWDGDRTVSFTFTPSQMYEHLFAGYYFIPTNLQGVESKKTPEPIRYSFQAKQVICSRVFNDGRQYMLVYGQPEILDTSDISVTDFKDENGNYYAESQRSQLVLVAQKPDETKQKELDDTLLKETALEKDDILASTSYEIDLQICGCITKVPNGSYMQVKVGFPDGYGPEDEGVTFIFYHYKHDDAGNITGVEEIPAIITQYGLIARVTSFSPFTVVAVKTSSNAVTEGQKAVYASVSGNGSLTTENGSGISLVEGNSITYTVKANKGYQVSHILLNGNKIDKSRYADGELTLSEDELEQGNMLEAVFVTEESAKSYANKGFAVAAIGATGATGALNELPKSGVNAGVIIACVAVGVVVIGAAAAIVVLLKKRNSKN
ncbi:MAG: hypothetical protein K2H43_04970 [Clostridia bacterium]|nr:hypothetical protein [Clostridia bacterium]